MPLQNKGDQPWRIKKLLMILWKILFMKIELNIPDGMRIGEAIWKAIHQEEERKQKGRFFSAEKWCQFLAIKLQGIEGQDLFDLLGKLK